MQKAFNALGAALDAFATKLSAEKPLEGKLDARLQRDIQQASEAVKRLLEQQQPGEALLKAVDKLIGGAAAGIPPTVSDSSVPTQVMHGRLSAAR